MTTTKDDTFHGFTIEDIMDLANEYKELKGKHDILIKKDELSKSIINDLNFENATQKKKVELLENEMKELKSQDDAKELSKKSMEEVEGENAKLKVKTLEQKKEINMLTSKVHRLQSEIKQSEENHQNKVKLLETQLNQQKEFVLSADVKNIIDKIKEAHNEMISGMEKAHNLEKSAIRMDGENKGRILLELQKKVQDLNAQNYI